MGVCLDLCNPLLSCLGVTGWTSCLPAGSLVCLAVSPWSEVIFLCDTEVRMLHERCFSSVCGGLLYKRSLESLVLSVVGQPELWGCEMLSTRSVLLWQNSSFNKLLARQCVWHQTVWSIFSWSSWSFNSLGTQSPKKFPALLNILQLYCCFLPLFCIGLKVVSSRSAALSLISQIKLRDLAPRLGTLRTKRTGAEAGFSVTFISR